MSVPYFAMTPWGMFPAAPVIPPMNSSTGPPQPPAFQNAWNSTTAAATAAALAAAAAAAANPPSWPGYGVYPQGWSGYCQPPPGTYSQPPPQVGNTNVLPPGVATPTAVQPPSSSYMHGHNVSPNHLSHVPNSSNISISNGIVSPPISAGGSGRILLFENYSQI